MDRSRSTTARRGRSEGFNLRRAAERGSDQRLEDRALASRMVAFAVHDAHAVETAAHGGGEKVVERAFGARHGEAVQIELGLWVPTAAAQLAQLRARQATARVEEGLAR